MGGASAVSGNEDYPISSDNCYQLLPTHQQEQQYLQQQQLDDQLSDNDDEDMITDEVDPDDVRMDY